jgi:hypothetical protein
LEIAGLLVAVVALLVSLAGSQGQLRLARHANVVPVLVDVFREHRTQTLADARRFVYTEISNHDLSLGLQGLPEDKRESVRQLMWYYDNLGTMVAHQIIDLPPVAGYLGGNVVDMWKALRPMVEAERDIRTAASDPTRWQWYFEYLASEVSALPPDSARASAPRSLRGRRHLSLDSSYARPYRLPN